MSTQESPDDPETDVESDDQPDSDPTAGTFRGRIDTEALEVAFDALDAAHTEAIAEITADRMVIHTVDPGDVLMVRVTLPADAWERYEAGDLRLGLRLNRLADMTTVGETATLEWDTDDYKINVESGPVEASLSIVDPDTVHTREPSQDVWDGTTTEWTMPYDTFRQTLQVTSKLGGQVGEIVTRDGGDWFGMIKAGDDDRVEAEFTDTDVDALEDDLRVLMSEDYLSNVRQATPTDADVHCQTKTEWPLIMEYSAAGVDVEFVQAPRLPSSH